MRIRLVTEREGQRWVLRFWAESLAMYILEATVGTFPEKEADFNVFVNYALYEPVPTKTAATFTHREHQGYLQVHFNVVANQVDWCFAQCERTAAMLPPQKTSVLRMYPQSQFYKESIILGVVGRDYRSGRKKFSWVKDLEAISGVLVREARGTIPLGEMPTFYEGIDYLVVLSDNEGGPMTVLEALAIGVPVIAPDVGHCWELPVLRYDTKSELLALVKGLVIPKDGWKQSAQKMVAALEKLPYGQHHSRAEDHRLDVPPGTPMACTASM